MRTPRRRLAALPATLVLAVALVAPGATPAAAAPEDPGARAVVVGGPLLGTTGVVVAPTADPPPSDLTAASWVVADLDTGQVLAAKDPHGRYAPASTLKTLTALALRPHLEEDRLVQPTFDDVAVDGSKVGLVEQVGYPAAELFEALMMVSGNDAANALATAVGGQRKAAALMNALARDLQARDTNAVNPSGLDAEGQLSSAYDLALIGRAALEDPVVARWAATRRSSVGAPPGKPRIETYNHNKLLANYDGALGIKNGYTSRARASFIGAAERDGRRLVVALMRAEPRVWAEAGRLLDWGFATSTSTAGVGQLVTPLSAAPPEQTAPAPVPSAVAQLAPVGDSTPVPEGDDGGPPWGTLTLALLLTGLAVAFRRRQVVVARRNRARRVARERARRRAAARSAEIYRPSLPVRRPGPPARPVTGPNVRVTNASARRAAS